MSAPRPAPGSRSVMREIVVHLPPESVWKALTDPTELCRWFPLQARVSPGPGGEIRMEGVDGEEMGGPIEAWEPEKHLRVGSTSAKGVRIATDYYLRAEAGQTVLRVVSSGFGADEDWDELYEAWGRGWDFELRGLRHYLEHHRGTPRLVAWARASYRVAHDEAWRRLVGPGGWLRLSGMDGIAEGGRYAAHTATGQTLGGVVHNWQPPRQFSGTAEGWNHGLFRIELYDSAATVWLSTWGLAEKVVAGLEASWRASLPSVLVGGSET